jgi:hypothetical protein
MKKYICSFIGIVSNVICFSQQLINQPLVYQDTVPYFYAWKDSVIQKRISKKDTYIIINDRITDTIRTEHGIWGGKNISNNDINNNDIIYSVGREEICRLSLTTGKIDTILHTKTSYYAVINNCLIGVDSTHFLVWYDIANKQKSILCEVYEPDYQIWDIEVSLSGIIHISLGSNDIFGIIDYLYDIKNKLLIKKDFSSFTTIEKDNYTLNNDIGIIHNDVSNNYMITGFYWMDLSFNVIQQTLVRVATTNRGFKIKESESFYYLDSKIDQPLRRNGSKSVWIPCRFTLSFDLCLYKIYNNQIITKNEIAGFDQWELDKLKNMIFAKHNYQFESHYLQAFYNIFQFYNNGTKNRVKEVNHLLTIEDKANFKLITTLMK